MNRDSLTWITTKEITCIIWEYIREKHLWKTKHNTIDDYNI